MEDQVGYGNPPKETRWKEGDPSPNPAGRPKGSLNRSTIARKWLEVMEKAKNPITHQEEEMTQEDIITLQQIFKARKGEVRSYLALMDSAHGAPKQQTEITGSGLEIRLPGKPDAT